jgi:hypothetical protein
MIRNYYNNIDWEKYITPIPISNDIYSSLMKNNEDIENILLKTLSTSINDDSKISQKLRFPHDLDLHQPLIWGDKIMARKL